MGVVTPDILASVRFLRLRQPDPETMTSLGTILPGSPGAAFQVRPKGSQMENDVRRERSGAGPPAGEQVAAQARGPSAAPCRPKRVAVTLQIILGPSC